MKHRMFSTRACAGINNSSFKKIQDTQAQILTSMVNDVCRRAIDPANNVSRYELEQLASILSEPKSIAALSRRHNLTHYQSCLSQVQSLIRGLEKQEKSLYTSALMPK